MMEYAKALVYTSHYHVRIYGKEYLQLSSLEVDDLCQWVYNVRKVGLTKTEDNTGTYIAKKIFIIVYYVMCILFRC